MFSMIRALGRTPHHLPPPKNYLNQHVFNVFGGGAGALITSHLQKNNGHPNVVNDLGGGAGGPVTSHLQKDCGNHHVFNDGCKLVT